jgi:3-hydroxyisobutyrate dehydrogenase
MTKTVAVLGVGMMGSAMARRLAATGHEVRAFDRSSLALSALGDENILVARSIEEAASGSDAVITMVPTGDIVASLAEQFLPVMSSDAVWIQTSTVGATWTERLYVQAERAGRHMIDSPVSGSTQPAESGQLTMIVSGPLGSLDRVRGILEALGGRTINVGTRAEASDTKLVVNAWMLTATLAMGEALQSCDDLHIGVEGFLSVLRGGPLNMDYALAKADEMLHDQYPPGFPAELAHKDLDLAIDAMGYTPRLLATVRSALDGVMADGHGRDDVGVLGQAARRHEGTPS